MKMTENLQFFLFILMRLVIVGGIIAYCVYRGNHPVKRSKLEKSILRGIGFAFAGALCVLFMMLLSAMWGSANPASVSLPICSLMVSVMALNAIPAAWRMSACVYVSP